VPFEALGLAQPVAAAHESLVQGFPSSQFSSPMPPLQVPDWQVWAYHARPLQ